MRVKKATTHRKAKKRIFKQVRGYWGGRSKLWRVAREANYRAMQYAFRGRKERKRQFRRLWIQRISAACRERGFNYSRFIHGLKEHDIDLNRKMLADLAVLDPGAFDAICEQAGFDIQRAAYA